jgi:hypothetical protein
MIENAKKIYILSTKIVRLQVVVLRCLNRVTGNVTHQKTSSFGGRVTKVSQEPLFTYILLIKVAHSKVVLLLTSHCLQYAQPLQQQKPRVFFPPQKLHVSFLYDFQNGRKLTHTTLAS